MDAKFFIAWGLEVTGFEWDYQLADYLGVKQGTLSGWRKRGLPEDYQRHIEKICNEYNVKPPTAKGGDTTLTTEDPVLINYQNMLCEELKKPKGEQNQQAVEWLMKMIEHRESKPPTPLLNSGGSKRRAKLSK